jgi:Na+/H+ antiporter NhaD/arsenite permease-like protein
VDERAACGLTTIVVAITDLGLAWGRIPGLHMDRAGIAWTGAALVLATTLLSFRQAVDAVDFLIVLENARRRGVTISFLDYVRAGLPVTLVSLAIGVYRLGAIRY